MSLVSLDNGWKQFGDGRRWRCISPDWLCEVDREGNIPSYTHLTSSVATVKRVRAFYQGKNFTALADAHGNLLDLLTANAMAESAGTVPTPFSRATLEGKVKGSGAGTLSQALDDLVEFIKVNSRYLVRKEPGYADPLSTPGRISVGAHHMLLSTALDISGQLRLTGTARDEAITRLIVGLAADSVFAADLALKYFHKRYAKHELEPPLMAAVYNAGSIRPSSSNSWNLHQYGDHVDRWVGFYNTSRKMAFNTPVNTNTLVDPPGKPAALELEVVRKYFTEKCTIGELSVDGEFHSYTLEDVVRDPVIKIYGETAIPYGRYQVNITFSNRFKKEMPLLDRVPGFEGVRIHAGNTAADTLGCILVGKSKGPDRIWDCKGVFDALLTKINAATPGKKCYITIRKGN